MSEYLEERDEKGFTLIELLVAIVVVGVLTAVAIVGIAGLTDKGSKSACGATQDAAKAATAVYYANSTTNAYPQKWVDMTGSTPAVMELGSGVTIDTTDAKKLNGKGWTLTITTGTAATDPITFSGCPA